MHLTSLSPVLAVVAVFTTNIPTCHLSLTFAVLWSDIWSCCLLQSVDGMEVYRMLHVRVWLLTTLDWTDTNDSEGSGSRALTAASYTNTTGMTEESCVNFCNTKSFIYAGVEYGSECCTSSCPISSLLAWVKYADKRSYRLRKLSGGWLNQHYFYRLQYGMFGQCHTAMWSRKQAECVLEWQDRSICTCYEPRCQRLVIARVLLVSFRNTILNGQSSKSVFSVTTSMAEPWPMV